MAQEVHISGATYSAVPGIRLPDSNGNYHRFSDASVTTAVESDVGAGKIFLLADGSIGTGTGQSGGASNHVTGTFTGTTTNAAMDIQIPYTGNGYPIAVIVFPTEGPYNSAAGTFYSKVQRYACAYYMGIKSRADRAPTYDASSSDTAATYSRYKNSTSSASSYSGTAANNTSLFTSSDAQNTVSHIVHIKPNNILSVFIASSSYGFMANVEYTYHVIYSG